MQLTFYRQQATPNRVDKSGYLQFMTDVGNVILKEDTNLMNPTFILSARELVYNSNYVYCDFTKRYYFIENIDALSAGRIAVHCKCDVLYTYKNDILNSSAWVVRSDRAGNDSIYNMLHNDYPFEADYDILGYDFPNLSPFNEDLWGETANIIYMVIK